MTLIRDLFASDVTRDIPPVVYFHEQSPQKLAEEVSEYIITGGWPENHPNHRRVPNGLHEQYVRLLENIAAEIAKPSGGDLPAVWISGFYGSGKSSFAKLLGLSLDGVALPDGGSLAEAWLKRDTSPKADELRKAWSELRKQIDPIAVVFDVGSVARDNEHIHSVAVRQVQKRLGYCTTDPLVADFELSLERDGKWQDFLDAAQKTLGKPWAEVKDQPFAEEDFSLLMSVMFPERYTDPMSWFTSRGGTHTRSESPEEAVKAIRDMIQHRRPGATLFLVIDEVSQYVLSHRDRVDRLRAFASALGSSAKGTRGKVWLLALGQQKLDEGADDSFLIWAKDRFPPRLRVHLAATNIRDVVHKRLLRKTPEGEKALQALFDKHRPELKLYAYGCENVSPDEFVETYPLLPSQIDLILQITSALRLRSSRVQGDDQAIRGLLQLLGELFREQKLADLPIGALVSLDKIYEVQQTALDADVQTSMARIFSQCTGDDERLHVRVAKVVSLLELIQDTLPTDAKLVAQCLYDRVDAGNQLPQVTEALEDLRRRSLLSYSEKLGYKIQSLAGEEWDRERRDIGVPRETISVTIQEGLKALLATPERPRLGGRLFPWAAFFSDGRRADDVRLADPREPAAVVVDLRFLAADEKTESTWVKRSDESAMRSRLLWLAGDTGELEDKVRDLARAEAMVRKYSPRRESLAASRKLLLQMEEIRIEDLQKEVRTAIDEAWLTGKMYFRGRSMRPRDLGNSFATALLAAGNRHLPDLFPHFLSTQVDPAELLQLVDESLAGASPKFLEDELGLLSVDAGRLVVSPSGVVPKRIQEYIEDEGGLGGTSLLAHFGSPPYGYTQGVVRACVAALLRAGKVRIQPEGGGEITAIRDAGVRDLFERDRPFRSASFFPAGEDDVGFPARARICKFFEEVLHQPTMEREDHAIADAAATHFPEQAKKLREVYAALNQLPGAPKGPQAFAKLEQALEQTIRSYRQTRPTVLLVKKHLDVLRDGIKLLQLFHAELTPDAIRKVREASDVLEHQAAQLEEIGVFTEEVREAKVRIAEQLAAEAPWREIASIDADLEAIRSAYAIERQALLQWQEQETDAARLQLKGRDGFSTLTADQSHQVLAPLAAASTNTSPEAIAPTLAALRDPFLVALRRAEDEAGERLDKILSAGERPMIARVELNLRNREIKSEVEVDALVEEIRKRLLEQLKSGARVRLL